MFLTCGYSNILTNMYIWHIVESKEHFEFASLKALVSHRSMSKNQMLKVRYKQIATFLSDYTSIYTSQHMKIGDCVHISLDILTMVDPYEVTEKEILKRKYGDMGKSNFLVQACIHTMAEISTKVG